MAIKKNKIIGKNISEEDKQYQINNLFNPGTLNERYKLETNKIMNKYKEVRMLIPLKLWKPNTFAYGGGYVVLDEHKYLQPHYEKNEGVFISVYYPKDKKLINDSMSRSDEFGGYVPFGEEFYTLVLNHILFDGKPEYNLGGQSNTEDMDLLKDMLKDYYTVKKLKTQYSNESIYEPVVLVFDIYKFSPKKGTKRTNAELLSEAEELRKEIKQTKIPAVKQTEEVPKLIKQAGSKIKHNKMVTDIEKLLADMGELKSKVHPDKKISKLISEAEAIVKQKRKVKGKGMEDSLAKAMPGLIQMFSLFK